MSLALRQASLKMPREAMQGSRAAVDMLPSVGEPATQPREELK